MTINISLAGNVARIDIGIPDLEAKIDAQMALIRALSTKADLILIKENQMVQTLDDIIAETARGTTVEASIETLLTGLAAQVAAAGGNQAKIDAIFAAAKKRNDDAAAAVVANTPATTPPSSGP